MFKLVKKDEKIIPNVLTSTTTPHVLDLLHLLNLKSSHFQGGVLNVVEAPDILYNETSNDTIVAEGASVTLRCEARGYPEPIVTWRREDGAPIVLRNRQTPNRSKMQIHTHSSKDLLHAACVVTCSATTTG